MQAPIDAPTKPSGEKSVKDIVQTSKNDAGMKDVPTKSSKEESVSDMVQ